MLVIALKGKVLGINACSLDFDNNSKEKGALSLKLFTLKFYGWYMNIS